MLPTDGASRSKELLEGLTRELRHCHSPRFGLPHCLGLEFGCHTEGHMRRVLCLPRERRTTPLLLPVGVHVSEGAIDVGLIDTLSFAVEDDLARQVHVGSGNAHAVGALAIHDDLRRYLVGMA